MSYLNWEAAVAISSSDSSRSMLLPSPQPWSSFPWSPTIQLPFQSCHCHHCLSLSLRESYCPFLPWCLGTGSSSPLTPLSSPSGPKGTHRLSNSSKPHKFPLLSNSYHWCFVFRIFLNFCLPEYSRKVICILYPCHVAQHSLWLTGNAW